MVGFHSQCAWVHGHTMGICHDHDACAASREATKYPRILAQSVLVAFSRGQVGCSCSARFSDKRVDRAGMFQLIKKRWATSTRRPLLNRITDSISLAGRRHRLRRRNHSATINSSANAVEVQVAHRFLISCHIGRSCGSPPWSSHEAR